MTHFLFDTVLVNHFLQDEEFYNSLQYVLENDPEPLCLAFSTTHEFLGEVKEIDLKPNGRDIPVTNDNKQEYIKCVCVCVYVCVRVSA